VTLGWTEAALAAGAIVLSVMGGVAGGAFNAGEMSADAASLRRDVDSHSAAIADCAKAQAWRDEKTQAALGELSDRVSGINARLDLLIQMAPWGRGEE
jgi:hypothetical protein